MICTTFDSNLTKVLFNVSDSFREGKNFNIRRKRQSPPMVVEAEVNENFYSEIESDSEISESGASDEDLSLNQEIEGFQKTNPNYTSSFFCTRIKQDFEIDN